MRATTRPSRCGAGEPGGRPPARSCRAATVAQGDRPLGRPRRPPGHDAPPGARVLHYGEGMSSRQQEKERRRQERLEAERAATRSASRRRRLLLIGGAALVAGVGAGIAGGGLAGGGGGSADTSNLAADAKAAGCTYNSYKAEGRNHTSSKVRYKTNPPTS